MMQRYARLALFVAIVLSSVAGRADAGLIIQVLPFQATGSTFFPVTALKFDPGLGSLQSVTFSVDATIRSMIQQVDNLSDSVVFEGANVSPALIFYIAPGALNGSSAPVTVPPAALQPRNEGLIQASNIPVAFTFTDPNLTPYIGSGTFTFEIMDNTSFKIQPNGSIEAEGLPSRTPTTGTLTLTYAFAPEPSSAVSAGIACVLGLGIVATGRHRARRSTLG